MLFNVVVVIIVVVADNLQFKRIIPSILLFNHCPLMHIEMMMRENQKTFCQTF